MTVTMAILLDWLSADHGQEEVAKTSALLRIVVGKNIATRVEDDWSQSVHTSVRLSAYPLALWLASSWWRLRWEPAPWGVRPLSWRMAHEVASAGYGYLWPHLTFESDGEAIDAFCVPSAPSSTEPVRYLTGFHESIGAASFENTIDEFIKLVLARLETVGKRNSDLHQLWNEVLQERADPEMATMRKYEAQLGFEPDEAPADALKILSDLSTTAGSAALSELAPACAGADAAGTIKKVIEFSRQGGIEGRVSVPKSLKEVLGDTAFETAAPWEKGRLLARDARRVWGFTTDALSDGQLSNLLGVPEETMTSGHEKGPRLPLALAIRNENSEKLRLLFRKRNRPAIRFEAARFLADHVLTPAEERWLPATDTKMARQKLQRAFAAEFLCPIASLQGFLGPNLSVDAIDEASEYFGVSPLAIRSHLANNDLLPFEAVTP